jgi:metallo-beta-lactamase class B
MSRSSIAAIACLYAVTGADAQLVADPAMDCAQCAAWNVPQPAFRIFGNTYYVGTKELSAILIAGNDGLVLLDAALPQSAPLIAANIEALGFATADIELIGNSHTHYDHAGGIAAFQRASGAPVAASPRAAEALRAGKPTADDPQFTIANNGFPPVRSVRIIRDGETLAVGDVRVTAHFTPGHTPGGTTWAWRSCEGARCVDIVYADSLNPVSADEFRFSGNGTAPSLADSYRQTIRAVEALPCDILLSPHPGFFDMAGKRQRQEAGATDAFVAPNACRAYAESARARLEKRLADEAAASL